MAKGTNTFVQLVVMPVSSWPRVLYWSTPVYFAVPSGAGTFSVS